MLICATYISLVWRRGSCTGLNRKFPSDKNVFISDKKHTLSNVFLQIKSPFLLMNHHFFNGLESVSECTLYWDTKKIDQNFTDQIHKICYQINSLFNHYFSPSPRHPIWVLYIIHRSDIVFINTINEKHAVQNKIYLIFFLLFRFS